GPTGWRLRPILDGPPLDGGTRQTMGKKKPAEQAMDPDRLGRHYFESYGQDSQKRPLLRYWRSEWWQWKDGRYIRINRDDLRAKLARAIKLHVDTVPLLDAHQRAYPVTGAVISNTMTALSGMTLVEATVEQPTWLGPAMPTATQLVSMK